MRSSGRPSKPYFTLPFEIHAEIFKYLDYEETLRFGFTCSYLWITSQRHLLSLRSQGIGYLAGESLVLVGDLIRRGDFPPSMEKENQIQCGETSNLYKIARRSRRFRPMHANITDYRFIRDKGIYEEYLRLPKPLQAHLLTITKPTEMWYNDLLAENDWILRNLTKKEYVRKAALEAPSEAYRTNGSIDLDYTSLLLFRTCWAEQTWMGMGYAGDFHRGKWAGDRFDFVKLDHHHAETGGKNSADWKDVTVEASREMAEIWAAQRAWESGRVRDHSIDYYAASPPERDFSEEEFEQDEE
ncbi:MAG: hypothetical protein MMC33_009361 [Icmadophila ericetorum]|nr:hypothetical protein [Icmadophila ericetorum]